MINIFDSKKQSIFVSIECVVHVEENNTEEPYGDEGVVDRDTDILFVLFDLDDEGHGVEDEHGDEGHPGHDGVVNPVIQKVDAQQGYITIEVPAIPQRTNLRP